MKEGGEARSSEGGGGRRRAKVQGWSWMEEKSRGVEGGRLQTARRRRNETGGTGRKEAEKGEERGRKREEKQTGTRPKRKPQNSLFADRGSERITKSRAQHVMLDFQCSSAVSFQDLGSC